MAETLNLNGATPDCDVASERAGVVAVPLATALEVVASPQLRAVVAGMATAVIPLAADAFAGL